MTARPDGFQEVRTAIRQACALLTDKDLEHVIRWLRKMNESASK